MYNLVLNEQVKKLILTLPIEGSCGHTLSLPRSRQAYGHPAAFFQRSISSLSFLLLPSFTLLKLFQHAHSSSQRYPRQL